MTDSHFVVDVLYHIGGNRIGVPFVLFAPDGVDPMAVTDAYFEESYCADAEEPLDYGVVGDGVVIENVRLVNQATYETLAEFVPELTP